MYVSLSIYFFEQIPELSAITYECASDNVKSIIKKEDIPSNHVIK